ncbi:MAG: pyruvate dehydrogenase E1 component [Gammaproteobacteria bacterium]|jgi:pyruvate dehydrogenase E1 component
MSTKNLSELEKNMDEDCQEWLESLDYISQAFGHAGVRVMLRNLQNHALQAGVALNEATLNTPYVNTIPPIAQPVYPGDIDMEKRIENIVRWNAMAMVMQAYDSGSGVGGHIATYASAATMLETGFNHFFRAKSAEYGGDMVLPQPHAAPGIYARAYLEGRLSQAQLKNFRRELGLESGLSSYPHPRSMPDFWQMPNASMGLSTANAIYQARFAKYLENRGLKPKNGGKIWCFIGDGESDEPEVLGTINIAAREKLDNLVLVVNCNLQRLDGPVRGNGKIIQELERSFRGASWDVIKVIWGSGWDALLAQDHNGVLRHRMEECLDGDYQHYSVMPGGAQREHWIDGNVELEKMMNSLTDEEVRLIKRGGQDPKKVYAAYHRASQAEGKPTVILIKTVKGEGMGSSGQGRNTAHQKKNLSPEERIQAAKDHGIPLDVAASANAEFYKPADDSPEMLYLQQQRKQLNGFLPSRKVDCPLLNAPELSLFKDQLSGSGKREISTTMSMVRMLSKLLKNESLGPYIVPIVPDEARTFGMDGLFKAAGIYSSEGQHYTPVDADSLMPYKETVDGQILQEGICEAGAMASFMAAGTAYAVHGVPTIPFYIYYSMFGFQRVGDMIWACGDMMTRGFLLGGTAGRTTLNGEGLQHQDGHSHILASTFPSLISYDPSFAYEIAIIVRDGIRRMYQLQENVFYYLTLYNENYVMPELDEDNRDSIIEGVIKGGYCWKRSTLKGDSDQSIHLLSSGSIMQESIKAANLLEQMGFACHIWSITSFTELTRDAQSCERLSRLNVDINNDAPLISQWFSQESGVAIAATDYMKAWPEAIAKWMPLPYTCLGTDGVGLSEDRHVLRDYFEVSARYIAASALTLLYQQDRLEQKILNQHINTLGIDSDKINPVER